jgi:hypothetical protein
MKEIPKKKQWKYNPIVKDLHTSKYKQRIKKPKQRYKNEKESIQEGLKEYFRNPKGNADHD